MAISQMDTPEIVESEKLDELQAESKSLKQEIVQLEEQVKKSNRSVVELLQNQEQLAVLLDQVKEKEKKVEETEQKIDPRMVEVDIDSKLTELEKEKLKLELQFTQLQEELGDRKDKQAGIVQVRPGGSGVDFHPTFVECRKEGIVVYDEQGSPHQVLASQMGSDVKFLSTLDEISNDPKKVVTFLLREDGVGTYYVARNVARSRFAKNGKLPVLGKGKLDLSLFMKRGQ